MKRAVGLLGLVLICSVLSAYSKWLEGGKVDYMDQRYERADSLFLTSIKKGLEVDESWLWHAKASTRLGDYVEGAKAFLKVMEADPSGEMIEDDREAPELAYIAFSNAANILLDDEEKADLVIEYLKAAIGLKPEREGNYARLGVFYLAQDSFSAARSIAKDLEKIDSTSAEVPYIRAQILEAEAMKIDSTEEKQDKFKDAVEQYNIAVDRYRKQISDMEADISSKLQMDPNQLDPAIAMMDRLDADSATIDTKMEYLADSLSLNVQQANYFLNWLQSYKAKISQALGVYDNVALIYTNYTEEDSLADAVYAKALELDPDNLNILWKAGRIKWRLKKFEEGVEIFTAYEELAGSADYMLNLYLGLCLLGQEEPDFDEAKRRFLAAKNMEPEAPDPYRYMAGVYDKQSVRDKANEQKWVALSNKWYDTYKEKLKAQEEGVVTSEETVYVDETEDRYHKQGCKELGENPTSTTKQEAWDKGIKPCNECRP